jgi:hypothetical protein
MTFYFIANTFKLARLNVFRFSYIVIQISVSWNQMQNKYTGEKHQEATSHVTAVLNTFTLLIPLISRITRPQAEILPIIP